MRVIAGIYGGRQLRSPSDNRTRPTSDRLRETLFNIISPILTPDTRFLDLCAGTGAIGIEALSRGAGFVTFVDRSRRACALIEENLDRLGISEGNTEVVCAMAETFTGRSHSQAWNVVFFDPPYEFDHTIVLAEVGSADQTLLAEDGRLIIEHHAKDELPDAVGHLRRWRLLKQGETRLSFFERG
jgi:16S rRNA (guanine(966)-N(2))-methyltransferase RsmD